MFCGQCGTNNPDTSQFCKNCEKTPGEKPWQSSLQQLRHLVQRTVSFTCCRRTGCCSTAGCARPVIISGLPGRDPEQLRTCRLSHSTNYGSKTVPGLAGDWGYAVRDRFVAGHPVYLRDYCDTPCGVSLYTTKKADRKIAIIGITGICIALASMLVNYFYLFIF